MKKWLGKLSRKWLVTGATILTLLTCSGIAYGAGQIVVHFSGGVGVTGTIHVVSPEPTAGDIVVISPDFTFTAGDTQSIAGFIIVQNNSAYNLTFNSAVLSSTVGVFGYDKDNTPVLPAHGQHSIPVFFTPSAAAAAGDFTYSGDLTYIW